MRNKDTDSVVAKANTELHSILKFLAFLVASASVSAVKGAANGATGYAVMGMQNGAAPGFTLTNTVASQAAGAAALSPATIWVYGGIAYGLTACCGRSEDDNDNKLYPRKRKIC